MSLIQKNLKKLQRVKLDERQVLLEIDYTHCNNVEQSHFRSIVSTIQSSGKMADAMQQNLKVVENVVTAQSWLTESMDEGVLDSINVCKLVAETTDNLLNSNFEKIVQKYPSLSNVYIGDKVVGSTKSLDELYEQVKAGEKCVNMC